MDRVLAICLFVWGCADGARSGDGRVPADSAAPGDAADGRVPPDGGHPGRDAAARDARAPDSGSADAEARADSTAADGAHPDARATDARTADAHAADARAADGAPPADARPAADAAGPDERGPDAGGAACPPPAGVAPLETPAGEWTWVPVDGMRCANGTPTGIGLNRAAGGSRRLFLYLVGGGACWDAASCYDDPRAAFIESGFGAADFAGAGGLAGAWFFDRANPGNPFAGHHQVLVPYCTGDLHHGNRVAAYGGRMTHHVGALNFEALARRLAATFPDVERVVISGGSAGGYGALFNWARTRAAFPCARVDLIDDSGPPLPPPHLPPARQAQWGGAWGFADTMPADCPQCVADWSRVIPYNLAADPTARAALLTTMRDGVISSYMLLGGPAFQRGIERLVEAVQAPRFGAFLVEGDAHVLMGAAPVLAGGQDVPTWIRAMQADDPAWGTVGPDPLPECRAFAECGACALCAARGPCAAEFRACDANDGCVDAVTCALACRADDVNCIGACVAAFPRAGQEAVALYTCARCRECPGSCGACP